MCLHNTPEAVSVYSNHQVKLDVALISDHEPCMITYMYTKTFIVHVIRQELGIG